MLINVVCFVCFFLSFFFWVMHFSPLSLFHGLVYLRIVLEIFNACLRKSYSYSNCIFT